METRPLPEEYDWITQNFDLRGKRFIDYETLETLMMTKPFYYKFNGQILKSALRWPVRGQWKTPSDLMYKETKRKGQKEPLPDIPGSTKYRVLESKRLILDTELNVCTRQETGVACSLCKQITNHVHGPKETDGVTTHMFTSSYSDIY